MKVWIVSQAWEGEIIEVFGDEAAAYALVRRIALEPNHRPTTVEEWEVTLTHGEQAGQLSSSQ
jgi:hypothetical protein